MSIKYPSACKLQLSFKARPEEFYCNKLCLYIQQITQELSLALFLYSHETHSNLHNQSSIYLPSRIGLTSFHPKSNQLSSKSFKIHSSCTFVRNTDNSGSSTFSSMVKPANPINPVCGPFTLVDCTTYFNFSPFTIFNAFGVPGVP